MAYTRSIIFPQAAEKIRELSQNGRQPSVGEMVQAVVDAGICGRGVAQQIVAELRKSDAALPEHIGNSASPAEPLPSDIESLLHPFDDLGRQLAAARALIGRNMEAFTSEMKASFGAIVTDQGVASMRADEHSRSELARLQAELAQVREELAEVRTTVANGEHQRADLYARIVEADDALSAYRAQVEVLEAERSRYQDEAENLRTNLDGYRRDLDDTRQAEVDLRAELRRLTDETVARSEHKAVQDRLAGTDAALVEERARNGELHAQVLRLVGAMTGPAETVTASPA